MQVLRFFLLSLSVFLYSFTTFAAADIGIDSIVVLGDSLSDQGRLYRFSTGYIPRSPYYEGRFSNGPVWVDYLAEAIGFNPKDLINYSLGGAPAELDLSLDLPPYTLGMQSSEFLAEYIWRSKEDRLYIIWIGGNDYWKDPSQEKAHDVVDTIVDNIETLMKNDARYFFLPNLPNVGLAPLAKTQGMQEPLQQAITAHNQYLHEKIELLRQQHPDSHFIEFDVAGFVAKAINGQLPNVSFANIADACYNGNYMGEGEVVVPNKAFVGRPAWRANAPTTPALKSFIDESIPLRVADAVSHQSEQEQAARNFAHPYDLGEDIQHHCPGYFFWDAIHPTTYAHQILGLEATRILKEVGVHRQ